MFEKLSPQDFRAPEQTLGCYGRRQTEGNNRKTVTKLRVLESTVAWEKARKHEGVGRGREERLKSELGRAQRALRGWAGDGQGTWGKSPAGSPCQNMIKLSQGRRSVYNISDCIIADISCCHLANIPTSPDRNELLILFLAIVQWFSNVRVH